MKTTTRSTNSVKRLLLRDLFLRISLLLICFGLSSTTNAVNPPPDGGYGGSNTAEGTDALFSLTSGVWNVAIGFEALHGDKTGNQNTATGYRALFSNTGGDKSTAYGSQALYSNRTGTDNVATGFGTLYSNITGNRNTGVGYRTLTFNNANDNTAIGWDALYNNTSGTRNTAIGSGALLHGSSSDNTAVGFSALGSGSGGSNTAVGSGTLYLNTTGSSNTAVGFDALVSDTTGSSNTATGVGALGSFMTGNNNTANGVYALGGQSDPLNPPNGSNNTAMGASALIGGLGGPGELDNNTVVGAEALPLDEGGHDNIAIGYQAGANVHFGDNNIEIGNAGDSVDSDGLTIRIGDVQTRAFIAGIRGATTRNADAIPVVIDSAGQLGTMSSSKRFKQAIKPINTTSEAILALNPVTFHYKSDKTDTPQFGLIAEEVAKVNPDLVVRDSNGEIYTVRYDAINAMLLNEFLKEHKKVEDLEKIVAQLAGRVKEQDSKIEKISNELDQSKVATHVVANR